MNPTNKVSLYYAFETCSARSYTCHVNLDALNCDMTLDAVEQALTACGDDHETRSLGTVLATSEEHAVAKIQQGDWEYGQT